MQRHGRWRQLLPACEAVDDDSRLIAEGGGAGADQVGLEARVRVGCGIGGDGIDHRKRISRRLAQRLDPGDRQAQRYVPLDHVRRQTPHPFPCFRQPTFARDRAQRLGRVPNRLRFVAAFERMPRRFAQHLAIGIPGGRAPMQRTPFFRGQLAELAEQKVARERMQPDPPLAFTDGHDRRLAHQSLEVGRGRRGFGDRRAQFRAHRFKHRAADQEVGQLMRQLRQQSTPERSARGRHAGRSARRWQRQAGAPARWSTPPSAGRSASLR